MGGGVRVAELVLLNNLAGEGEKLNVEEKHDKHITIKVSKLLLTFFCIPVQLKTYLGPSSQSFL